MRLLSAPRDEALDRCVSVQFRYFPNTTGDAQLQNRHEVLLVYRAHFSFLITRPMRDVIRSLSDFGSNVKHSRTTKTKERLRCASMGAAVYCKRKWLSTGHLGDAHCPFSRGGVFYCHRYPATLTNGRGCDWRVLRELPFVVCE